MFYNQLQNYSLGLRGFLFLEDSRILSLQCTILCMSSTLSQMIEHSTDEEKLPRDEGIRYYSDARRVQESLPYIIEATATELARYFNQTVTVHTWHAQWFFSSNV